MKIYTKKGDTGETSLLGNIRVSKSHIRVATYGDIDELNAWIGFTCTSNPDPELLTLLLQIQRDLFSIGSVLADPQLKYSSRYMITEEAITRLEDYIDKAESELPPLKDFILPGGSKTGALLHFARTVTRRAERHVVALAADESVEPIIITYLNRLSDFLFVAARLENNRSSEEGSTEVKWHES